MIKFLKILVVACLCTYGKIDVYAQTSNNIMVGGGLDAIKTDNIDFAGKAQIGFEGNYFVSRSIGLTAGIESWTAGNNYGMLGIRWYPAKKIFTRFRALIGQDTEFGIGAGYSHLLSADWRLEGMADYYFDQQELGLRLGAAYIFRK